MKKLIIIAILLLSTITYAQETFVRTYKSYIYTKNDVKEEEKEASLTIVFNYQGEKIIKFYWPNGKIESYRQVSKLEKGKTEGGYEYQYIDIVSLEDGVEVGFQLFDNINTARIIFNSGDTMEFYE
jgi:hypothetical protein